MSEGLIFECNFKLRQCFEKGEDFISLFTVTLNNASCFLQNPNASVSSSSGMVADGAQAEARPLDQNMVLTNPDTDRSSAIAAATALIQEVSPLPKCSTSRKRTRQVEGAEVVTGSPYKQRVLEKELKKSRKSQAGLKDKMHTKKKVTCRSDKPRGRKPANRESNQATSKKETRKSGLTKTSGQKGEKKKSHSRQEDDVPCIYCDENYSNSVPGEEWIQCGTCRGWCHVDCSSGESSRGFICDFCC